MRFLAHADIGVFVVALHVFCTSVFAVALHVFCTSAFVVALHVFCTPIEVQKTCNVTTKTPISVCLVSFYYKNIKCKSASNQSTLVISNVS